jgi:hypothetical protein
LRPLPIPNRPSNNSDRASSALSLRSKRAHSLSARDSNAVIAGPSSDARLACAAARVEAGVSSKCYGNVLAAMVKHCGNWRAHTRVADKTAERRGKSLIPASRIEIEESSNERDERSDDTEAERETADDADWPACINVDIASSQTLFLESVGASPKTR